MKATSRILFVATATAVCLSAQFAAATIIITVGDYVVLPNTAGQSVDILVTSDDPTNDSLISGMNLHVEIGDGIGAGIEPVFDGVAGSMSGFDFSTSIFSAGIPSGQGPVAGATSAIDAGVTTTADISAMGILVSLLIDTTGFSTPGSVWELDLALHSTPFPSDTELLGPIGSASPLSGIVINNGSIRIVPEPSSTVLLLLAMGMAGIRSRWRHS